MASTSTLILYVEAGYVDDNYVAEIQELAVDLNAQPASASGVAEVAKAGSGVLETGNSSVSGVAEREITSTGQLTTGESSVSATVSRTVSSIEADLTADEVGVVTVAGDGERKVITQVSALAIDDDADIVGAGVRTSNSLETTLSAQATSTTGVAERQVGATAALSAGSSIFVGVAEREIVSVEADLTADEVGVSSVTGDGEREVVAASITLTAGTSTTTGVSERTIVGFGEGLGGEESVVGVAELAHNVLEGTLSDDESSVSGVAERTIVSVEADLTADEVGVSSVTGDGEREIVAGNATLVTGTSSTTGVAERIITGFGEGLGGEESVVGVGVVTHVGTGTLQITDDSKVSGDADRGSLAQGSLQITDDSKVSGAAERIITAIDADLTAEEVGVAVVAGDGERSIVPVLSAVVVDSNAEVEATVKRTVFQVGGGVLKPSDNNVVSGSASREQLAGDLDFRPTEEHLVSGVAERIIPATDNTAIDDSIVSGVSERTITASGALENESVVLSDAERIIPQVGGGALKPTDNNIVVGETERVVTGSGSLVATDAIAIGVAEREIVESHAIEASSSVVEATVKRTVHSIDATIQAQESTLFADDTEIFPETGRIPLIRLITVRKPSTRVIISKKQYGTRIINVRSGKIVSRD